MSDVKRVVFMLDGCVHCEPLSSAWDHLPRYVPASDYDTLCDEWRVATGAVIMQRKELAELRDELAALKACQGEAVAYVSAETFSSDGTSDIITCNLPIGTKLYLSAPPASAGARLVPVELLRDICSLIPEKMKPARKEIRALLAQSQEAKS